MTGRCYCGASSVVATGEPEIVTYCHCADCRRVTGAPVAAFAAFRSEAVDVRAGKPVSHSAGVARWFCRSCGSPMAACFDYLPGQVFVPVGVLDKAADLAPVLHCHSASALPWLTISDDVPREAGSGRAALDPVK
ncbi:GFA family protein [Jannaschia aquimarina]|uniref:Glutathione-dependent formaldehyde-activating enzyme n=1 Tax=Jannaschia aquimarina TaxID=935700 RepID=A0A0D1EJ58_9RHOB|nr:GFA family protein [Jannaschia aquimarina]KIT17664.1 Glutathione-dependent formaldehyde-activating enzyme [Jannaschia aquimarina]SNS79608.1 Uncharacterized conserved protein [Jannaschia aquimarina]